MKTIAALMLTASAACAATLGQQTITLNASATQLACGGQRYVNKLTIRVIPGFVGKVFVGTPAMDPNAYTGTLAILFPNLGAHSEEYTVQDPSGDDGIDLCGITVAGEVPGENAIAEYVSNNDGTTPPANLLVPAYVDVLPADTPHTLNVLTLIRVQSIPGFAYPNELQVQYNDTDIYLAPNTGDITQHNAWSERWERADPLGANGLSATLDLTSLAGSGQSVLLSGWQKYAADGSVSAPIVPLNLTAGFMYVGDLAAALPSGPGNISVRIHKVPGIYYDSKDEIDDSQGNALGLLFPNTTGTSWSEAIDFGSGSTGPLSVLTNSGNLDLVAYDVLTAPASGLPPVLTSVTSQVGGYVAGGSAISRGYVKHLRVQVVPGGAGLVFLGTATMNTATLDGVYAILYPNALGRWSETFELDDPEGDGISTDDLYVQTEIPGEQVIVSTTTTGITPADGPLTVKASGALSGTWGSFSVPFASSSTPIALLRAQAIPGGYEKLWIGTAAMTAAQPDPNYNNVLKVLWPSQGNFDIGEGHSERFVQSCALQPTSAPNCLDLQNFTFWPELPWEQLLVFALGR